MKRTGCPTGWCSSRRPCRTHTGSRRDRRSRGCRWRCSSRPHPGTSRNLPDSLRSPRRQCTHRRRTPGPRCRFRTYPRLRRRRCRPTWCRSSTDRPHTPRLRRSRRRNPEYRCPRSSRRCRCRTRRPPTRKAGPMRFRSSTGPYRTRMRSLRDRRSRGSRSRCSSRLHPHTSRNLRGNPDRSRHRYRNRPHTQDPPCRCRTFPALRWRRCCPSSRRSSKHQLRTPWLRSLHRHNRRCRWLRSNFRCRSRTRRLQRRKGRPTQSGSSTGPSRTHKPGRPGHHNLRSRWRCSRNLRRRRSHNLRGSLRRSQLRCTSHRHTRGRRGRFRTCQRPPQHTGRPK